MSTTTTIKAGESAKTVTLPEGKALVLTGAPGTAGVAYLLDQALGGTNSLRSWAVGAGTLAAIGPYENTQKIHLTCSAGWIAATVKEAVLTISATPAPTAPGQPAKPVLTAMAGAVSLAWTPGAAGSTATTSNIWTDINGNVTQLTTNPQTITAPAGTPYTGTVTTLNAQGAGPASAQADAVTPTAGVVSDILYPEKIASMLAAMKSAGTQRTAIAYPSMSIIFGAGSAGTSASTYDETAFSTLSTAPRVSAILNVARGGTFARGIEVIGGFSDASPLNPFFTLGGGAVIGTKYSAAAGPSGVAVILSGGAGTSVSFPMTSAVAGQVVKIYGYVTGGAAGVLPRYSLSGANTQAATALPGSTTAAPVDVAGYYWYEQTLTMANAGTTTVTLLAPSATGASFLPWGVDPDFKTSAGLTIHRVCKAGETTGTLIGAAIDDTDTNPPGIWTSNASKAQFRAAQTKSVTTRLGVAGVFSGDDVNAIISYNATTVGGNATGAYGFGWTLADHQRHYQNFVNDMAAKGLPVLFIVGHLRNPATYGIVAGTGTPYTQTDVINVIKAVAAASTNAAVLDLSARYRAGGANTEAQAYAAQVADTSMYLAAEASSGSGATLYVPAYVHPSPAGHNRDALYIADQISKAW